MSRRLLPLLLLLPLLGAHDVGAKPRAIVFGTPVLLTPAAGGYEPAVARGPGALILVTAHKENSTLVVAPDAADPALSRTASWAWSSRDGGRTYTSLPVPAGVADPTVPGIEGDIASDDAGHIYLADMSLEDLLVHRWTHQAGVTTWDYATHLVTARGDDRPWLAAHGNGRLVYLANDSASPAGRFASYASFDGARTFGEPVVFPNSRWCRPVADRSPGSRRYYVVCSREDGDGGMAFISGDDGRSYAERPLPSREGERWELFPSIATNSRGLVVATTATRPDGWGARNEVLLYSSRDHGRTWRRRVLPLPAGEWSYASVDLLPSGGVGFAAYHRPGSGQPWRVYAGVFGLDGAAPVVPVDSADAPAAPAESPYASGDLMGCAFDRTGRLTVSWTRSVVDVTQPLSGGGVMLHREIYAATQRR